MKIKIDILQAVKYKMLTLQVIISSNQLEHLKNTTFKKD